MKNRKTKKLWFLEKIEFQYYRDAASRKVLNLPFRLKVGEGIVSDFTNGRLCISTSWGQGFSIRPENVIKKKGKLSREECLTYDNEVIRAIGLDDKQWI